MGNPHRLCESCLLVLSEFTQPLIFIFPYRVDDMVEGGGDGVEGPGVVLGVASQPQDRPLPRLYLLLPQRLRL